MIEKLQKLMASRYIVADVNISLTQSYEDGTLDYCILCRLLAE